MSLNFSLYTTLVISHKFEYEVFTIFKIFYNFYLSLSLTVVMVFVFVFKFCHWGLVLLHCDWRKLCIVWFLRRYYLLWLRGVQCIKFVLVLYVGLPQLIYYFVNFLCHRLREVNFPTSMSTSSFISLSFYFMNLYGIVSGV